MTGKKKKKMAGKQVKPRTRKKRRKMAAKGDEARYIEVRDLRDATIKTERMVQSPDGTQGMIPESENVWNDPYRQK